MVSIERPILRTERPTVKPGLGKKRLMPETPFESGSIIDSKYEVLGKIGRGGMATVYKVKELKTGKFWALKSSDFEYPEDTNYDPIADETKAYKALPPNGCYWPKFYDRGKNYLVCQYFEGVTLGDKIKTSRKLSVADAIETALLIARALKEAKIPHKDLKPANVMLNSNQLIIIDWAITFRNMKEGTVAGTPTYMSPEQFSSLSVNYASDIYALGVIIYEMLIGSKPFHSNTISGLHSEKMSDESLKKMPPETFDNPSIRWSIQWLIDNMTITKQKDREEIFQTWDEVIEDLESISNNINNFQQKIESNIAIAYESAPTIVDDLSPTLVNN
jgi:serine/threonine-protein kinase